MHGVELFALLDAWFDPQTVRWTVWGGLVLLTVSLMVLMRTRWGQSNPLGKCVVLSLLAHLLLGIYTTTVQIVTGSANGGEGPPLRVSLVAPSGDDESIDSAAAAQPWDALPDRPISELAARVPSFAPDSAAHPEPAAVELPVRQPLLAAALPGELAEPPSAATALGPSPAVKHAAAIDAPNAERADAVPAKGPEPTTLETELAHEPAESEFKRPLADVPSKPVEDVSSARDTAPQTVSDGHATRATAPLSGADPFAAPSGDTPPNEGTGQRLMPVTAPHEGALGGSAGAADAPGVAVGDPLLIARAAPGEPEVPSIYQLRLAPDHTRQALAHGGTRETEAAVKAALTWLALHQSADGRWDGKRLEAGRDAAIDGHERRGAGTRADTGITGLALLAFLASGHTQHDGEHSETVRKGLNYLLSAQGADGNLGGNATLYEKMYCHAMATFAMSEAYAMTHDAHLQNPVRRAIGYSLTAQHGAGGWRYQPGEPGDTSQLGWQFMALKSAELAGIPMPDHTRDGMIRFLKSVSSGTHGGLASYRPGHGVSRTMTAEALVCRQFLGMARANPAGNEAADFVLEQLPGQRQPNFYYWYYATLGLYQLQGPAWERWNQALQQTLVGSQRTNGDRSGSWDPDPIWGAYGGRAYSTALGALCLEVYYRFLPLYIEAAGREAQRK